MNVAEVPLPTKVASEAACRKACRESKMCTGFNFVQEKRLENRFLHQGFHANSFDKQGRIQYDRSPVEVSYLESCELQ